MPCLLRVSSRLAAGTWSKHTRRGPVHACRVVASSVQAEAKEELQEMGKEDGVTSIPKKQKMDVCKFQIKGHTPADDLPDRWLLDPTASKGWPKAQVLR